MFRRLFTVKRAEMSFWLVSILILGSQLNYLAMSLFSPHSALRHVRVNISPEFAAGVLVFSLLLIFYMDHLLSTALTAGLKISLVFLITFIAFMAFSVLYHGVNPRYLVTLLSLLLYFWAAKVLAERYGPVLASRFIGVSYLVTPLFVLLLSYLFFTGRIYFRPDVQGVDLLRPGIQGGIKPTELAIFVGLQLIYLLHGFQMSRSRGEKGLLLLFSVVLLPIFLCLLSVGALLAYGVVLLLYILLCASGIRRIAVMLTLIGLTGLTVFVLFSPERGQIVIEGAGSLVREKFRGLAPDGIRGRNYSLLWSTAMDNPAFGIGWGHYVEYNTAGWLGRSISPHNNLLGIAAENGFVPALLYLLFVVSIVAVGAVTLSRMSMPLPLAGPIKSFLFVAVGCFVFLQMRGLFQDTWQIKETYFWAGIVVGISNLVQGRKHESLYVSRDVSPRSRRASPLARGSVE